MRRRSPREPLEELQEDTLKSMGFRTYASKPAPRMRASASAPLSDVQAMTGIPRAVRPLAA